MKFLLFPTRLLQSCDAPSLTSTMTLGTKNKKYMCTICTLMHKIWGGIGGEGAEGLNLYNFHYGEYFSQSY